MKRSLRDLRSKIWSKLKELSKSWAFLFFVAILVALAITVLTSCSLLSSGGAGLPPMDANGDGILDQAFKDAVHNLKETVDGVSGGTTAPATGLLELIITGVSSVAVALGARQGLKKIEAKKAAAS